MLLVCGSQTRMSTRVSDLRKSRLLIIGSLVRVQPPEPNLRKAVGDLSGGLSFCFDCRRFRNKIKRLAQGGGQFSVPPGAVRNQEIEGPPFFARVLLCEKALGVLGQFEKAHAVFEIGLVGALMALDVPEAAVLLGAPFCRHLLEESGVDVAVELVDIGGVDAVLEPVVYAAQALDGGLVLAPLVRMALVQVRPSPDGAEQPFLLTSRKPLRPWGKSVPGGRAKHLNGRKT